MKRILAALFAIMMLFACAISVAADNASTVSVDTESRLYKKCALFVGDSICEASNDGRVGWAGRIMKWNSMRGVNAGKSAASISTARGANTVIAQLKAQEKNSLQYDFVIMHGGVNDAWDSAPVGVMTEGFDAEYDITTFAGGLEATFKYAKSTFTNAKFGYIINFRQPLATAYGRLSDMSEYVEMTKQICDKWGIVYLDLYNDEDLNNNLLKTNTRQFVPDTVHPNTAGYEIISPIINDWMKTIPDEEIPEESSEDAVVESEIVEDEKGKGNANWIIYTVCGVIVVAALVVLVINLKKK